MPDTPLPGRHFPAVPPGHPPADDAPLRPAILVQALTRLDAITAAFLEEGPLSGKNADDLLFELESQNDQALEAAPDAVEITLLQLLQASTAKQQTDGHDADHAFIHDLIEEAFLEQEALSAIAALWPVSPGNELTSVHLALLEATVRPHVSGYALRTLNALAERITQQTAAPEDAANSPASLPYASLPEPDALPDYRESRFLTFGQLSIKGDPDTAEAFARALRILEAITDHFLESGDFWEKTPTDLAYELGWHNAWQQFETAKASKAGQTLPDTPDITLAQLQALSKRRIHAFDDTGWNLTQFYRPLRFLDRLIDQALEAEQALGALETTPANLKATGAAFSPGLSPI